MSDKPLLVGESNPYGADPYFALYPEPEGCAGWRLCHRILGLTETKYLRTFDRVNVCEGPWDLKRAREYASEVQLARSGAFILLGAKVCQAFRVPYAPFSVQSSLLGESRRMYVLPHPSGRCRIWNDPGAAGRARDLLKEVIS